MPLLRGTSARGLYESELDIATLNRQERKIGFLEPFSASFGGGLGALMHGLADRRSRGPLLHGPSVRHQGASATAHGVVIPTFAIPGMVCIYDRNHDRRAARGERQTRAGRPRTDTGGGGASRGIGAVRRRPGRARRARSRDPRTLANRLRPRHSTRGATPGSFLDAQEVSTLAICRSFALHPVSIGPTG